MIEGRRRATRRLRAGVMRVRVRRRVRVVIAMIQTTMILRIVRRGGLSTKGLTVVVMTIPCQVSVYLGSGLGRGVEGGNEEDLYMMMVLIIAILNLNLLPKSNLDKDDYRAV
jgi:hypothetical protein